MNFVVFTKIPDVKFLHSFLREHDDKINVGKAKIVHFLKYIRRSVYYCLI